MLDQPTYSSNFGSLVQEENKRLQKVQKQAKRKLVLQSQEGHEADREIRFTLYPEENVFKGIVGLPPLPDHQFDQDIDTDEEAYFGSKQ